MNGKIILATIGWTLIVAPLIVTVHEILSATGILEGIVAGIVLKIALTCLFVLAGLGFLVLAFRGKWHE